MEIQALFFETATFAEDDARAWAKGHDFSVDVYRVKLDKDSGDPTHHIFAQFPPDDPRIDSSSWAIISENFPDGVSATICHRRKSMDQQIQTTKGVQSDDDPFTFVMSDESTDRVGDVIRASGWQIDDFLKNPVALWVHDHDKPIGVWEDVKVVGKRLMGKLKLAKPGTSPEIDTIRSLVEQRIIRAVSVGFQPLEAKPLDKKRGYEYIKQALHECSLVAVPANANALSVAKSLGADPAKLFSGEIREPTQCASSVTQEKRAALDAAINKNTQTLERLI